jgi:chromosome segregation protein
VFLKRVTVTGFKSFANKTVLDLEPGLTGIVGPNGSGKSNLADAIRWALGEQSKGRLRLTDRDEVVFAGTEKRAKASYAEVVLLFDNEDGAFPLDLTEVEISRRLYRSGEADYRLSGRSVRLGDIQALLAQAGLGTNTYAVIGQGMIDSFLLSSPAERKLLFDEAAGIRGPELSREAALRKLTATEANLTRLRDISAELSPRLSTLEKAVGAAGEQQALERRIGELRTSMVAARLAHWGAIRDEAASQLKSIAAAGHKFRHEQTDIARQITTAQAAENRLADQRRRLQDSLAALERQRDQLAQELTERRSAVTEAQRAQDRAATLIQELRHAQAELTSTEARQAELEAELASNTDAAARALKAVERAGREVAQVQATLGDIRKGADEGTRDQYVDHALQILKTLAISLGDENLPLDQIRLLIHKAGRLLSHATRTGAAELLDDLKAAQKRLEAAMNKRETAIEHQTNVTITLRSLEIDLAHQRDATQRAHQQATQLQADLAQAETAVSTLVRLKQQAEKTAAALATATGQLEQHRHQVRVLSPAAADAQTQAQLATALERSKAALAATELQHAQYTARLAEAQNGLADAHQQARAWGIASSPPAHPRTNGPSIDDLQAELVRTEALLEARTSVQKEQILEYQSVSQRTQELTAQITDLETAHADLERVIVELNELIRTRFKDNFQALAKQFSTYFTQLFGGGAASLELEEAADSTYGIVIKVSPKGKRLTSIAALSGGERALAGVALLAAILRVNPSPFVVLDEIDAALDEANSGRLAAILGQLQEHSQLIAITHNRQTMQAARVLFGVTINDHHVSQLLSMRLEAATQLAAR